MLTGQGAVRRGVTFRRLWRDLLGREPGTLPVAQPAAEPDRGLSPDASVAWMNAFVAERRARAAATRERED